MSCSSSTTRMSSAINRSPSKVLFPLSFRSLAAGSDARRVASETHDRSRAAAFREGKAEFAAVLLDDLLYAREAETGALLPGRHVGLHDADALLRQPDAVIGDADRQLLVVELDLDGDPPAIVRLGIAQARVDRLGGVLEHVGHRLSELVPVAFDTR